MPNIATSYGPGAAYCDYQALQALDERGRKIVEGLLTSSKSIRNHRIVVRYFLEEHAKAIGMPRLAEFRRRLHGDEQLDAAGIVKQLTKLLNASLACCKEIKANQSRGLTEPPIEW